MSATYAAAAAAYDDGGDGEMLSHTCAHVKTYKIAGNGQKFLLMNLKCMLRKRTQMKLGEDGELFLVMSFGR